MTTLDQLFRDVFTNENPIHPEDFIKAVEKWLKQKQEFYRKYCRHDGERITEDLLEDLEK